MLDGVIITLGAIGLFVTGFALGTCGVLRYLKQHLGIVWCDGFFEWEDTGERVKQKGEHNEQT